MKGKTIFISGIDTCVGKTLITGYLAKRCVENNINVITQKITQTGVSSIAEDIWQHRKIMNTKLCSFDSLKITCPYTFSKPASPHLAASLENQVISTQKIKKATELLESNFELVLLEGAGGLHVPLNTSENIIDYIQENNYPLILVTNSKLGSINHTLLSLEVLKRRKINLIGLVYNKFPKYDNIIEQDSIQIFKKYIKKWFGDISVIEFPIINSLKNIEINELNKLIKQIKFCKV